MRQYFGTDGIRGKFGEELKMDFILNLGLSAGKVFKEQKIDKICLGEDTRSSSSIISKLLIAGLNAAGIEVVYLKIVTTPCISYSIVNNPEIKAGIMVSASHNPYYDNGIKFFGSDGQKISDTLEEQIEEELLIDKKISSENLAICEENDRYVEDYKEFIFKQGIDLTGKNIGLDMANGSAYKIAQEIYKKLGATTYLIGDTPNGININENIGSTHPEKMQKLAVEKNLDFAFCFDGDADRVQLIDSDGDVLDGDYILYILGKDYLEKGKLKNNSIVTTVMSNLGFKNAITKLQIENRETQVGDRYVMQEIINCGANLGGEQSGHIILSDLIATGDGVLTSVILSKILVEKHMNFEELKKEMFKFPQILINYECKDKDKILENSKINEFILEQEKKLSENGRILVRASGTENLIRVMVEAHENSKAQEIAELIVQEMKMIDY